MINATFNSRELSLMKLNEKTQLNNCRYYFWFFRV